MRTVLALVALTAALARTASAQGDLSALWGSGPNDVWALGSAGAMHFDGRAWTWQVLPVTATILDMRGSAPGNIWAIGMREGDMSAVVFHFDGTRWDTVPAPRTKHGLKHIAVTPSQVFVEEEVENEERAETDSLAVHVWNGRTWTHERLPFAYVSAGMQVVGNEVWIAGYTYHDPRRDTRNQHGVLLRRVAGRWVSSWTGRRGSDPVIDASSWSRFAVAGDRAVLYGQNSTGTTRLMVRRGAAWQPIEMPTSLPAGARYLNYAFVSGDGSPVLSYQVGDVRHFLRYTGTTWEPVYTATVTPAAFPATPGLSFGFTTWSPPGSDQVYSVFNALMVGKVTPGESRILAATWCLGAPGGSGRGGFGPADAGICTAIAAGAGAAPPSPPR